MQNLSFSTDLNIFFKTILKVIKSSDVAVATNHVTEDFDLYRQRKLSEQL